MPKKHGKHPQLGLETPNIDRRILGKIGPPRPGVITATGRLKSRVYLILQQLLGAIQRLEDSFHIDCTATFFAHKCLRIGQSHRFATFRAGHKLIGADSGDANGLRIATPQPRAELSQWPHGAITPFAGRPAGSPTG
jgi:hypothetical protein